MRIMKFSCNLHIIPSSKHNVGMVDIMHCVNTPQLLSSFFSSILSHTYICSNVEHFAQNSPRSVPVINNLIYDMPLHVPHNQLFTIITSVKQISRTWSN